MADEKKRLPWWLAACAAVLVLLAIVLGFVETVGRQGTLVGQYERIGTGMSEIDIVRILDQPHDRNVWSRWVDGPARVYIHFGGKLDHPELRRMTEGIFQHGSTTVFTEKYLVLDDENRFTFWHVRRWAEQAYTAIHGPRR